MAAAAVRIRIDFNPSCAIGPGKISLLEAIARTGSLSQAARALDMSYLRAWRLIADCNHSFRRPVVALSAGGRGGGGARLTEFGMQAVAAFRRLEAQVSDCAATTLAQLARAALRPAAGTLPRRPLQKPVTRTAKRALAGEPQRPSGRRS